MYIYIFIKFDQSITHITDNILIYYNIFVINMFIYYNIQLNNELI